MVKSLGCSVSDILVSLLLLERWLVNEARQCQHTMRTRWAKKGRYKHG
jgi:hypothetical protein